MGKLRAGELDLERMQTDAIQWGALSYFSEETGQRGLERVCYREGNPGADSVFQSVQNGSGAGGTDGPPRNASGYAAGVPGGNAGCGTGDPKATTFHSVLELLILLETALEQ